MVFMKSSLSVPVQWLQHKNVEFYHQCQTVELPLYLLEGMKSVSPKEGLATHSSWQD
jgi:hypothetical protein